MLKTQICVTRPQCVKNIPIYIQQEATLHRLFYLETALYVSGGTSTHHQERKQLYLQHLVFVRPLLLPAAIAAGSSNGVILHIVGYILEYSTLSHLCTLNTVIRYLKNH